MEIWLVALVTGDQILRVCAIRSGRACLLASLKEANICTESRHCWILDFFFFLPGSVSLSYYRLKLETYLSFSFSNMFAVTLMWRNKIKIALPLKMWGRRNRNTNFFKGGWRRMRQGEGHHKNNDRGGHTKASYHTWSLASSFPNNPHKDSTLPRRFITQRPRTGPGQARDLRLGQLCALTEPHAVSGNIEFPRNVDTYSESSAPETVPLPPHLEPGNITLLCQTVWVHLTRSSCCDLGIMKKPTRG